MNTSIRQLLYPFRSGKPPKYRYFAKAVAREFIPACVFRSQLKRLLTSIETRADFDEITTRTNYYCKLDANGAKLALGPDAIRIRDMHFPKRSHVYYFDAVEYLRYFDPDLKLRYIPGDQTQIPNTPGILKSRPIAENVSNANSVLLKLGKIRHFIFVNDQIPFDQKQNTLIYRGKVNKTQPHRIAFFDRYFGVNGFDIGNTSSSFPEWRTDKLTINEQLRYKFILSLEGNDVASNLKWIFSSNSLPVMPKPKYEIWFQEGLLIPDVHYIEIKPDYSDIREKLDYYLAHPELCAKMNEAEHQWVNRFKDPMREKLIALNVLNKYFSLTN